MMAGALGFINNGGGHGRERGLTVTERKADDKYVREKEGGMNTRRIYIFTSHC